MVRMNKYTLLGAVISAFSEQIAHLRDKTVELMRLFTTEVMKFPPVKIFSADELSTHLLSQMCPLLFTTE